MAQVVQDRLSHIGECGKCVGHDETLDQNALRNSGEEVELTSEHRAVGDIEPIRRPDQSDQRVPRSEFLDQNRS